MRYPHGLQLDIGVESDPFEDIGCQILVWIVTESALEVGEVEVGVWSGVEVAEHAAFAPAVPHSVARPLGRLGLADGDGLAAGTMDVCRGNPGGELVSNGGEVCERVLEPSFSLNPGLLGRNHVEDGRAGWRVRSGRLLQRRPRKPGKAERSRRRTEGDAV